MTLTILPSSKPAIDHIEEQNFNTIYTCFINYPDTNNLKKHCKELEHSIGDLSNIIEVSRQTRKNKTALAIEKR